MNMEHVVKVVVPREYYTEPMICKVINTKLIRGPLGRLARTDLTKSDTFVVYRDMETGRFKKIPCTLG